MLVVSLLCAEYFVTSVRKSDLFYKNVLNQQGLFDKRNHQTWMKVINVQYIYDLFFSLSVQ